MGLQLLYSDVALARRGATITASTDSADFPAANLLQPARGTVYRITGTIPATIDLDINIGATLGASFAVSGAAVLNLRSDAPSGFEPMIDVYQSTSPTFSGSPVSSFPGFSVFNGKRDRINKLASGYIAQYWRFRITTNGYGFSIGKLMLGIHADLGYFWSPKSTVAVVEPGDELRTIDKTAISVMTGEVHNEYALLFEQVGDGEQQLWDAIVRARSPFGMVDALGNHVHARIAGARRIDFEHDFGVDPSLWTFTVPIEAMP